MGSGWGVVDGTGVILAVLGILVLLFFGRRAGATAQHRGVAPETTSARINKRKRVIGWVAVALSTYVVSRLVMFVGPWGWLPGVGRSPNVGLIVAALVFALVAVRWSRIGGSLFMLAGAALLLVFILNFVSSMASLGGPTFGLPTAINNVSVAFYLSRRLSLSLPAIIAGLLYFPGKPEPRRLAYAVIIAVPLLVFASQAL
jgi:hypothetical protein